MGTRTYAVTLTGKMPMLHHADNIDWADSMDAWKNDPENKKGSKAGDDRSPAFRWLGSLYHDGLGLEREPKFAAHRRAVETFGFSLHVKRAKVGQAKHIRVRPMFDRWALAGLVHVWDEQITAAVLLQIVTYAGLYKGLGDWRPGGKTPGPFGMFSAAIAMKQLPRQAVK